MAADLRRVCADALTAAAARATSGDEDEGLLLAAAAVTWEDVREAARACVPSQLACLDVVAPPPAASSGGARRPGDDEGGGEAEASRREFAAAFEQFGGYAAEKGRLYRAVVRPWRYHMAEAATVAADGPHAKAQDSPAGSFLGSSKPSGVVRTFYLVSDAAHGVKAGKAAFQSLQTQAFSSPFSVLVD